MEGGGGRALGCHARRDLHHALGRRAVVATEQDPDEAWMARAVAIAEGGRGRVSPNPMVGAVLVRDGRVVGEGFHRAAGQPHAEAMALAAAGAAAVGAGTALADDPRLTVRLPGWAGRQPLRVLVDAAGRVGAGGHLFDGEADTLVATTPAAPAPAI